MVVGVLILRVENQGVEAVISGVAGGAGEGGGEEASTAGVEGGGASTIGIATAVILVSFITPGLRRRRLLPGGRPQRRWPSLMAIRERAWERVI